jgi:hypothetical protein
MITSIHRHRCNRDYDIAGESNSPFEPSLFGSMLDPQIGNRRHEGDPSGQLLLSRY